MSYWKIVVMDIETIRQGFASLKAQSVATPRKTKKELIKELAVDIRELRAAGHSYDSILAIIANGGVTITEGTLKKYMTEVKTKIKSKAKKTTASTVVPAKTVTSSGQREPPAPASSTLLPKKTDSSFVPLPDEA